MSGFALGIVVGCLVGVLGTLLLLLLVYNIPDGEYVRAQLSEPWRVVGVTLILILACGALSTFLPIRRVSFAVTVLLASVLITAHLSGMLASWVTLAVASVVLCLVLPPAQTFNVSRPEDRLLLVFFVLCGAIGTRLIATKQRA